MFVFVIGKLQCPDGSLPPPPYPCKPCSRGESCCPDEYVCTKSNYHPEVPVCCPPSLSKTEKDAAQVRVLQQFHRKGVVLLSFFVTFTSTVVLQWPEDYLLVYHGCFELVLESLGKSPIAKRFGII